MQVSTARFANLYSLYSWPNVILCFFGGFMIDRVFGVRWGAVIFGFIVLLGQVFLSLGAFINTFWLMELGSFSFGVGLESLLVCQNTYAPKWFEKKELNMVFGLQLSVARMGSTLNFVLNPIIYSWVHLTYFGYTALGITLFVVSLTCVLSQLAALMLAFFDWRADKILQRQSNKSDDVIRFSDVKDFPLAFWLVIAVCICYYGAVIPFVGLGKVFFLRKYEMTDISGINSSSTINGMIYVMSAFAAPILGLFLGKVGHNSLWILLSVIFTLFCFLLLCFTFINPWIPMVLIGLGYSLLASSLWPMLPHLVPQHQLATAYGLLQSFQNLGLAVSPMIAGVIVDINGYIFLQIFFIGCLCVSAISAFFLFVATLSKSKSKTLTHTDSASNRNKENFSMALIETIRN